MNKSIYRILIGILASVLVLSACGKSEKGKSDPSAEATQEAQAYIETQFAATNVAKEATLTVTQTVEAQETLDAAFQGALKATQVTELKVNGTEFVSEIIPLIFNLPAGWTIVEEYNSVYNLEYGFTIDTGKRKIPLSLQINPIEDGYYYIGDTYIRDDSVVKLLNSFLNEASDDLDTNEYLTILAPVVSTSIQGYEAASAPIEFRSDYYGYISLFFIKIPDTNTLGIPSVFVQDLEEPIMALLYTSIQSDERLNADEILEIHYLLTAVLETARLNENFVYD